MKRGYPFETHDRSFFRSIRSLKGRGLIEDYEVGETRWISLPPGVSKEDQILFETSRQITNMVSRLARARGLPPDAVRAIEDGGDPNKHLHHIFEKGKSRVAVDDYLDPEKLSD